MKWLKIILILVEIISLQADDSTENDNFLPVSKLNLTSLPLPLAFKSNNIKLSSIIDKSVTLTCSINLDNTTFFKTRNYKVIWSRESDNGKDYEPLFLDDSRLIFDQRITATRFVINKKTYDQLQWNLIINNLRLTDTNNYICQLNQSPYDVYWLKKFTLHVYEPASFLDENPTPYSSDKSIYVKDVNEHNDFKLKCSGKGKPKPTVSWFLKYLNGTSVQLEIDSSEILIKNIKYSSKLDTIYCQISNGYGAAASRIFKINVRHIPHMLKKSKTYKVPTRTQELLLNCTAIANPSASIHWVFLPRNYTNSSEIRETDWKLLNRVASFISSKTVDQLPIAKYYITEKFNSETNQINSILIVKIINENDYGTFKCFAFNELGNSSVNFKIQELTHHNESFKKVNIKKTTNANSINQNISKFIIESVYTSTSSTNSNSKSIFLFLLIVFLFNNLFSTFFL